ncbi:hypothetical protein Pelo_12684 [Pelomyxa schiedti]|nr:hypothetical protein Pelo_12684 [Pelomyxa schiedti]
MVNGCPGNVWLVVPMSFVTGMGSASLGASAWMMVVPILLLFECWKLYDVLFIACCMDIASSAAMTAVYFEQKYIWKAPLWLGLAMVIGVIEITVVVALLHNFAMENQGLFETCSAAIAFLLGSVMLIMGVCDIVNKCRAQRSKSGNLGTKLNDRNLESAAPTSTYERDLKEVLQTNQNDRTHERLLKQDERGELENTDERKVPIQWILARRFHVPKAITITSFVILTCCCYLTVGFFGWGSGAFSVILLVTHTDIALHTATGTSSLLTLVSSAVFAINVIAWNFTKISQYWELLISLVAGQLVGTFCGTVMVLKIPKHLIKAIIGAVLLAVGTSSIVTWSIIKPE